MTWCYGYNEYTREHTQGCTLLNHEESTVTFLGANRAMPASSIACAVVALKPNIFGVDSSSCGKTYLFSLFVAMWGCLASAANSKRFSMMV